jgi:hypothetical protein
MTGFDTARGADCASDTLGRAFVIHVMCWRLEIMDGFNPYPTSVQHYAGLVGELIRPFLGLL